MIPTPLEERIYRYLTTEPGVKDSKYAYHKTAEEFDVDAGYVEEVYEFMDWFYNKKPREEKIMKITIGIVIGVCVLGYILHCIGVF